MAACPALFTRLLPAADWLQLASVVRRMHAEGHRLRASGMADIDGANHGPARLLRHLLGLPAPGHGQAIALVIQRHAAHEHWLRSFQRGRMGSTLRAGKRGQLHERLGPVSLHFTLHRDGDAIDWQLRRVCVLGLPLPRALHGNVLSRSGVRNGRYEFQVDARLPLIGRLIAYRGWLEIDDAP